MSVNFQLKRAGVAAILKSAGVRSFLTPRANAVLSAARSSAPVETGAYRASLHVKQDTTDRVAVRVAADVDYALVVEAESGTLARALDAAG